jgi:hypothetical protein
LRTAGGRELRVPHPEFLMITPPGRTIVVADVDGSVEVVDPLPVESLRYQKNGSRRSR